MRVGIAVALCAAGYFALPFIRLPLGVSLSLREQQARNEAAQPLLDAVVTRRIKLGDGAEVVKRVLADAGLTPTYNPFDRRWEALYSTGRGSGIAIQVYLDKDERVSSIKVHPLLTGP